MKWEERQGVIDALHRITENPNIHMRSTGGDVADVLRQQGVIAEALLLLIEPPIPIKPESTVSEFERYERPTVGEFDYPKKDSGTGPG